MSKNNLLEAYAFYIAKQQHDLSMSSTNSIELNEAKTSDEFYGVHPHTILTKAGAVHNNTHRLEGAEGNLIYQHTYRLPSAYETGSLGHSGDKLTGIGKALGRHGFKFTKNGREQNYPVKDLGKVYSTPNSTVPDWSKITRDNPISFVHPQTGEEVKIHGSHENGFHIDHFEPTNKSAR